VAVSKQEDGQMAFNSEEFVASRPAKYRPVLTSLLSSQAFHQFIDERLDVWNSCGEPPNDMFEEAISHQRELGSRTPAKVSVCQQCIFKEFSLGDIHHTFLTSSFSFPTSPLHLLILSPLPSILFLLRSGPLKSS